jgi:spermidine/putrescine transport system ATP-binding protein
LSETVDVEFRRVTKAFGDVRAVDAVDLQVQKGEFLSLLGPSGCGKTTSLRMIAGFEQPTSGEVLIGGVDATGIPPWKRDVNTVFQQYALFPHLSVLDNVSYGLKQRSVGRGERDRLAREALELVQLRGLEARRPRQLSGGQQQRVALARALVMRPRVLLLDEPLGALDLKLRKEMQIELKRLQTHVGISFVYVTHDQEEAMAMSDRIAVMARGKIEQLDAPLAVYDRPATAFVADFIGDMNFLEGTVTEVDNGRWTVSLDGAGVIHGRGSAPRGVPLRIGLRPEKLLVAATAAGDHVNTLHCTLATRMELGDQVQLVAELPGGRQLVAREQRALAASAEHLNSGDPVVVSFGDDAPILLPADEHATVIHTEETDR